MIRATDLTYRYPTGQPALDRLNFAIAAGESVGLVGANGAGKTTLFHSLAGILPIPPGVVSVAGLDPAVPEQRKQLPRHLGIVFQNSDDQLFCATVADDVAFGPLNLGLPPDDVRRRVADALGRVGMAGADDRVPFQLSGGEKRRVAIAGVLAMQPDVLLLDEPSMFLDARGRRGLIRLLQELPMTRLIASHDLGFIRETCRRIVILDAGRIVAEGSTELLSDRDLMESHGLDAI
jgi:cobalt/nickel transport system ATP-binding protein